MTVVNNRSQDPIYLAPPSTLVNNTSCDAQLPQTNSGLNTNDNINLTNVNIVPSNYPQVSNNIPANIFPQQQTTTQTTTGTVPTNTGTTATTNTGATGTTNTQLKPVTMTEAQWAVKFEEKYKKGYQPTPQEMAKYQDIVARFKANPKVDSSIVEMLAAQSSSLGAQVASMRYGKDNTTALRGLKPTPTPTPTPVPNPAGEVSQLEGAAAGASGGLSGLKGIGGTLLKGTGLSAIVAGGFSLVTNGLLVMQGRKTWSDVGGTVAADTANGAVSGLTGTIGAGVAGLLVGGTGLVPTLVIGLGAMGGAWLGDKLFRGTGLYDKIKDKIDSFFDKSGSQNTTQQFTATSQYQAGQTQPKFQPPASNGTWK